MATPQPIELYIPDGNKFETDLEALHNKLGAYWYAQRIGCEELYVMYVFEKTVMAVGKIPEPGLYNIYPRPVIKIK